MSSLKDVLGKRFKEKPKEKDTEISQELVEAVKSASPQIRQEFKTETTLRRGDYKGARSQFNVKLPTQLINDINFICWLEREPKTEWLAKVVGDAITQELAKHKKDISNEEWEAIEEDYKRFKRE